jgi:hypothetical protein
LRDFKVDANKANNPGHIDGSDGSFIVWAVSPVDWNVYNLTLENATLDMLHFTTNAKNVAIHDCTFLNSGHDAIYLSGLNGHVIRNCYIYDHGDKAVRLYHTTGCLIENNDFSAGDDVIGLYTDSSQLLSDTIIQNCVITNDVSDQNSNCQGIKIWARGTSTIRNITIKNNRISRVGGTGWSYQGGIWLEGDAAGCFVDNVTIENNDIYDTWVGSGIEVGLRVDNVVAKNNIIINSTDYGINGPNITSTYNDVWNNAKGNYSGGASAGTGDISEDPLYADVATYNFHLQSQYGRWNGTAWVNDAATSPCIDAGDPSSAYPNEPEDNGNRINMGAYGNTKEASKSQGGFLVDILPPITTYITTPVVVTFFRSDTGGSGISYTNYSKTSETGPWTTVTTTATTGSDAGNVTDISEDKFNVTVAGEGTTEIWYYSVDTSSNVETTKSLTVITLTPSE